MKTQTGLKEVKFLVIHQAQGQLCNKLAIPVLINILKLNVKRKLLITENEEVTQFKKENLQF